MHVGSSWNEPLAEMGNEPGQQAGNVVIRLAGPLQDVTLASDSVTFLAEAGSLIGLLATLPDGSRCFWPAGSVLEIADAPKQEPAAGAPHAARDQ